MQRKTWVAALATSVAVWGCGGGEVVAVVSFLGSVGGDWRIDNAAQSGFQQRADCGVAGNELCFVNLQIDGTRDLFGTEFKVSYTGNLKGKNCPAASRFDGVVSGNRVVLPDCFQGTYRSINEVRSDDGDVAYFDSEVPDLSTGVWVEIRDQQRRFKFQANPDVRTTTDVAGCELTSPAVTPAQITVDAANINGGRLRTDITALTVGGQTWSGRFEGVSGMRLTRGNEVLELERRDLPGAC